MLKYILSSLWLILSFYLTLQVNRYFAICLGLTPVIVETVKYLENKNKEKPQPFPVKNILFTVLAVIIAVIIVGLVERM
ncbi:hypothetical protein EEL30_12155 [Brevibacillus laterosporus]|uniref:Uncharacterized protein n=1 Tax=Brevibacillus laterosporus TaxID=1465 RepID=A0A518V7K5_BRELA|nr:hypothetical protein EEL30_12155 [Brevibacillus laterosporus]